MRARSNPVFPTAGATGEGDGPDTDLKTRVAWLYFMEGLTQDAIAERLGVSRLRVLKILALCRQDGTVQIRVTTSLAVCVERERALEARFGFARALVIPTPTDPERLPALLGAEAGAFLTDALRDGMRVGLGWGTTLRHSLTSIGRRGIRNLTVVSLLGALTRAAMVNPSELAWRLANLLEADCYMLSAPVFVGDDATHAGLLRHPGIVEVLDVARRVDLALVSVGDMSPGSTIRRLGLLSNDALDELRRAGAVADILCRFIDAHGGIVDHPLNRRVVALDPTELRRAPRLVLVSGGWNKVEALRAAIRLLRPHVLITDEEAAAGLLSEPETGIAVSGGPA